MASNPPAKCCTIGVKHDGEPSGQSLKIGNIDAYLAVASGSNKHTDTAILYLPDVLGIWQNAKLMADQYAANGYTTLLVDLFNGDPLTPNMMGGGDFDFMKWLSEGSDGKNPHTKEHVDPIVLDGIKYLQTEQGAKKIGSVGYCFGAKYVVRHYKDGIDVGYIAHPSFVDEDELEAISGPLSIAAAETDSIFPAEKRHKSEEILQKVGQPYQVNLYSQVSHGFAVRCDLSVKQQKWAKEQAFNQAVQWFDAYLL